MVRQSLPRYVDRIPHLSLDRLGGAVRVASASETRAYRVTLRTPYESRSYRVGTRPHWGEAIAPPTTTEATIDSWSYRLEAHADLTRLEHRYHIDETQEVRPCDDCPSAGLVTSPGCRGEARGGEPPGGAVDPMQSFDQQTLRIASFGCRPSR